MSRSPGHAPRPRRRDEAGSTLPLIIGFAMILVVLVAVVVDVSAAFLRRQSLDNAAEGAALHGADRGAEGEEAYSGGLGVGRLGVTRASAQQQVAAYLRDTGAFARYPGLRYTVHLDEDSRRVEVRLRAPLELPLGVPGVATHVSVSSTGTASVLVDRAS